MSRWIDWLDECYLSSWVAWVSSNSAVHVVQYLGTTVTKGRWGSSSSTSRDGAKTTHNPVEGETARLYGGCPFLHMAARVYLIHSTQLTACALSHRNEKHVAAWCFAYWVRRG